MIKVLLENYGYRHLWEIQDSIIDGKNLICVLNKE
jgi:hypothetical protein